MKKRVFGKKLARSRTARNALYRSLTRSLLTHGEIETTFAKAKALQRYVDKLASIAQKGDLSARRSILASLANDKKTANQLFEEAKDSKRKGGFTKITPLPQRRGDQAKLAKIKWLGDKKVEEKQTKKKKESKSKEKTNK